MTGEIKSKIDKVWEAFWTGGLSNPLTVIEQMTYLLFIRKLDEEQKIKEAAAFELEQPIDAPIYLEKEYPLRWSRFKDLESGEMFHLFIQPDGIFDFIRNMGNQQSVFSQSMRGATFMIPTPLYKTYTNLHLSLIHI
jgi:type I restriction enzyme M protein